MCLDPIRAPTFVRILMTDDLKIPSPPCKSESWHDELIDVKLITIKKK